MNKLPKKVTRACLSLLLAIIFVLAALPFVPASAAGGDLSFAAAFNKSADPDTGNTADKFPIDINSNGRIWTDKTVSAETAVIYDAAGKPIKTIDTKADEFLITLSALSQSYTADTVVEPTDTVFILDVSASMYINKLNDGRSRVEAMVDALNKAIATLMEANSENRVAVIAFGGDSGEPRIVKILELGRYKANKNIYFSMESAAYIQVNCQNEDSATPAPLVSRIRVFGGTPTQLGIYAGAKLLMENLDTDYTYNDNGTPVTVPRKPNIILLSDGGATFGWTDYTFGGMTSDISVPHDHGDANNTDIGIDILTVLTAAYVKEQIQEHYYGAGNSSKSAGFYTIGLAVGTSNDAKAVLDPIEYAQTVSRVYLSKTYNMKTVLEQFVSLPNAEVSFPALNKGASSARSLITIRNKGVKSYDYIDRYYSAEAAGELAGAFESIAQQIVSTGSYVIRKDPNGPPFGSDLIFSDVLGEYMEFKGSKGLWFDNKMYDGHLFAESMLTGGNKYDEFIDIMIPYLEHKGNPADTRMIVKNLLDSCIAAGKPNGGLYYNSPADFSNKIKYYADEERNWVGNYFDSSGNPNAIPAGAKCVVDIYIMEGAVRDPVTGDDMELMAIALHVVTALVEDDFECAYSGGSGDLVRHLKAGQQVVRWYIPASLIPMRTVTEKDDGVHIKEAQPIRFIYAVGLRDGLAELRQTYYTNAIGVNKAMAFFWPNAENPYYSDAASIHIDALTNNGWLNVPFTEVTIGKMWYSQSVFAAWMDDEYVQLYANGVALGEPVLLECDYLMDDYTWKDLPLYELKPDADGKAVLIEYTVAEGTWDGVTFTPYDATLNPTNGYAIYYQQPELSSQGRWWEGNIVNYEIDADWYLTIEKIVKGDAPAWGPNNATIEFEILDESGATVKLYDAVVYPMNFIDGKCHIPIEEAGTYTVREVGGGAVAGYSCDVSVNTDYSDFLIDNNEIVLTGVSSGETVNVTFTNTYVDVNFASLTITKTFSGENVDEPDDIAFEVSGPGAYRSVVYYNDFVDSKYTLNAIRPGSYTVTELGGEVAGYKLSKQVANSGLVTLAPGSNETLTFTNTYNRESTGNKSGNSAVNRPSEGEQGGANKEEYFAEQHIWYVRGYEDNTLRPDNAVSRAEAAMVFYRLLKPELKELAPSPAFTDVSGDEWYGLSVGLLAHYGIFEGYEDGSFRPERPITRGELAALVSRFDQLAESDVNPFDDLDTEHWAYNYILSAAQKGWVIGDGDGKFRPDDDIKRSEFVTAVNRVLNRHILPEDIPENLHKFDDFDSYHWSYAAFTEALYSHSFERKEDGIYEDWAEINGDGFNAPYNK